MKSVQIWKNTIKTLQDRIGYHFKDESVLMEALTHSSFANEWKQKRLNNNERLEFLGDSVLSLIISQFIFKSYRNLPEGELTKVRATVVCEGALAQKARSLQLGEYILLGKGEESSGGRNRDSILADAMEALIAAIYIDGNYEDAKEFVLTYFEDIIDLSARGNLMKDYKTQLQELIQSTGNERMEYKVTKEEGPDHNKTFYVEVKTEDKVLGHGSGKNKKEAEQNAAKAAIEYFSQEGKSKCI
ncbi:MAG: ribonuclease III [Tindallia sp. MSAO_Bac2]|nr:MAG: ribonuclease III [Tindallia sp. MSAO_Bac2]